MLIGEAKQKSRNLSVVQSRSAWYEGCRQKDISLRFFIKSVKFYWVT